MEKASKHWEIKAELEKLNLQVFDSAGCGEEHKRKEIGDEWEKNMGLLFMVMIITIEIKGSTNER